MNKLQELMRRCDGKVQIAVNDHLRYGQTVYAYLDEREKFKRIVPPLPENVKAEMIAQGVVVKLRLHYKTMPNPVAFLTVWHYDLEMALDNALEILNLTEPAKG